jgi:predicted nucleic acid-binding protein
VILYLDASALVKLYVEEEGAVRARDAAREAEVVATCEVAYVEARAALARRFRERGLSRSGYRQAVRDLDADWPRFFLVAAGGSLVIEAGVLAERYALRAYDALHLASGLATKGDSDEDAVFACWDRHLARAAAKAGLNVLP